MANAKALQLIPMCFTSLPCQQSTRRSVGTWTLELRLRPKHPKRKFQAVHRSSSLTPRVLGVKAVAGASPAYPSSIEFIVGKTPCQLFPTDQFFAHSSPGFSATNLWPPRAAYSHSPSVGNLPRVVGRRGNSSVERRRIKCRLAFFVFQNTRKFIVPWFSVHQEQLGPHLQPP